MNKSFLTDLFIYKVALKYPLTANLCELPTEDIARNRKGEHINKYAHIYTE